MAEENVRECPKDCRRCEMQQQIYCSVQMNFNMFEVLSNMMSRIADIEQKLVVKSEELAVPIKSVKRKEPKENTQKGDGVTE